MPEQTALARIDINALAVRAIEDKADVEIIERLLAVAKEVRAENAKAAWHEAMSQFQAEAPTVAKSKTANVQTRTGGKYSYRYAPLEDMIAAARPILSKFGLSVVFQTIVTSEQVTARAIVSHAQGHSEACEFSVPIDLEGRMNPAQQVGSAATYARRYAYQAALGMAPDDDDDGNGSGGHYEPERESRPPIAKPQAKAGTFTSRVEPSTGVMVATQIMPSDPPTSQPPSQHNEAFGKITKIDPPKPTAKGGQSWIFYDDEGNAYRTFSDTVADLASQYVKEAKRVVIEYEDGKYGRKALGISEQTVFDV